MAKFVIGQSKLQGRIAIPPSKSHTLRALVFSLMAKGRSEISHYLPSPDTAAMIDAIRLLGARVDAAPETLIVQGTGGNLLPASDVIHCGNSGQVLRFISALAALSPSYAILTGDDSIRQRRPMQPLLNALTQLGAFAQSSRGGGYRLAKTASETSIADVVVAVDEPLRATRCSGKDAVSGCMKGGARCLTHDLWEGAGQVIHDYFASVSLADVANGKLRSQARAA